jgi:hypothetical protein
MIRRLGSMLGVSLAVAALAWGLYSYGPLRQLVVAPVLFLLQTLVRVYQAIPPSVVWLFFVLAAYLMASTGWLRAVGDWLMYRRERGAAAGHADRSEGRVATLARWVARRSRGTYSRHYLKNVVSELAVEQLAQTHRLSVPQVKMALETNALQLPPEVNAYLLAGLSPWPLEPGGGLREWVASLGLSRSAPPPDADTENVIQFLEDQLNGPLH